MDISQLAQQISDKNHHAPVEKWDPPYCGDMDIVIKADGQWDYMGTPIKRKALVKLFASVLTLREGDFYLVTPVEKVRIKVEGAPFMVTHWRVEPCEFGSTIVFSTNVDDEFVLSTEHSLVLPTAQQTSAVYLDIHRGMQAALHRNVYYQLAEMAEEKTVGSETHWIIKSGNEDFILGKA